MLWFIYDRRRGVGAGHAPQSEVKHLCSIIGEGAHFWGEGDHDEIGSPEVRYGERPQHGFVTLGSLFPVHVSFVKGG